MKNRIMLIAVVAILVVAVSVFASQTLASTEPLVDDKAAAEIAGVGDGEAETGVQGVVDPAYSEMLEDPCAPQQLCSCGDCVTYYPCENDETKE